MPGFLQLTDEQLYDLVLDIRNIAELGHDGFRVIRNNKTEHWKNALLNELSDEIVYNHLRCLHPFQFFRCNLGASVYEFRVCFYKENIYLKVNTKTKEVLSFHFDENPDATIGYNEITHDIENTPNLLVIVSDAPKGRGGPLARFAIGSHIINQPIDVAYSATGLAYIDNRDYLQMIEHMGRNLQKRIIRGIEEFNPEGITHLIGSTKNYQILSMSENQLSLVSLCFDICENYTNITWGIGADLVNQAIDILLRQPERDIKRYMETRHPSSSIGFPRRPETQQISYGRSIAEQTAAASTDKPGKISGKTPTSRFDNFQ